MDIDNLLKVLSFLKDDKNTAAKEQKTTSIIDDYIGKYVIVRTRNEGINAGYIEKADETGIVLKDARRIYYHRPKDESLSWYEGVAQSGLSDSSKISNKTTKVIIENYSITICSDTAKNSIEGFTTNVQS